MSLASIRKKNNTNNQFTSTRPIKYSLSNDEIEEIKENFFDKLAKKVNYGRLRDI